MKKSRNYDPIFMIALLLLSSLTLTILADQSSALESSLDVPQDPTTLFDPTRDTTGSDDGTGTDLTSSPEVRPVPQRRQSSFRADLGKRFSVDLSRLEGKRGSKTSFRPDLGKRGWKYELPMHPNFKDDDGEQLEETRYEDAVGSKDGSVRRKRFAVGELERQVEEESPSGRWMDIRKRAKSSFRADLGKRFKVDHGGQGEEGDNMEETEERGSYPKRGKYAFRGDLGKRSPELLDADDKRRYAFRGDLGRKRSLTLESRNNRLPLSPSSFGGEERLRKLVGSSKGIDIDPDCNGGLEKRRFRSDLG